MAAAFIKHPVPTRRDDLLVFACLRNEEDRLPFFLDYYRRHGVKWFFIVDNDSTDGSAAFLNAQPDVVYFHTSQSYVESRAGRYWTTELAEHYGRGRWCLTLDVDELLAFPGCENVTIAELTRHLDSRGFEALFCVFLDMYSDRPLSQTVYTPGTPFTEICDHFEIDTYELRSPRHFPYAQIFGGPRQRQFWDGGGKGRGPSMRKTPLVKWRKGFSYLHSTHSMTPLRVADMTGALLHFKFFSSFRDLVAKEVVRGDRMQMEDYRKYAESLSREDPCFMNPASRRYEDSLSLVSAGAVAVPHALRNFIMSRLRAKEGPVVAEIFRDRLDAAQAAYLEACPKLSLAMLPHLWPFFHAEHWGQAEAAGQGTAASSPAQVRAAGPRGRLVVADATGLRGWAMDRARPHVPMRVRLVADGEIVGETVTAGLPGSPLASPSDEEASSLSGLAFHMPRPTALVGREAAVTVLAAPLDAPADHFEALAGGAARCFGFDDLARSPIDGVCERWLNGRVRGWAVNRDDPHTPLRIDVLWDGRLRWTVTADHYRADLERSFGGGGLFGFSFDAPDGHDDGGRHELVCRVAHSGLVLRRCPVVIEGAAIQFGPRRPGAGGRTRPALLRRLLAGVARAGR